MAGTDEEPSGYDLAPPAEGAVQLSAANDPRSPVPAAPRVSPTSDAPTRSDHTGITEVLRGNGNGSSWGDYDRLSIRRNELQTRVDHMSAAVDKIEAERDDYKDQLDDALFAEHKYREKIARLEYDLSMLRCSTEAQIKMSQLVMDREQNPVGAREAK